MDGWRRQNDDARIEFQKAVMKEEDEGQGEKEAAARWKSQS